MRINQLETKKNEDFIDDLILMKILGKLINNIKEDQSGDVHDAQCSTCQIRPIENLDRYHCLICSSDELSYDLCSRCFEKRLSNGKHLNGHPMIHFKLPNEYLGILLHDIKDLQLNQILQCQKLINEKHQGIKCDGICNQINIQGLTFKCDTCHNYHLCYHCAFIKQIKSKTHQLDHPMILTSDNQIPRIDHQDIQCGEILGRGGFGSSFFSFLFFQNEYFFKVMFVLQHGNLDVDKLLVKLLKSLKTIYQEILNEVFFMK